MSRPLTFYVLGAGASYGLVPLTQQIRRIIQNEYHKTGTYPTSPAPQSTLHERIIGPIPQYESDDYDYLLRYIPYATLDALTQLALYVPPHQIVPPQYAVFNVFGSPSTIFNFNLDGLAYLYCGHRHIVFEPHGRVDREWIEHKEYRELLNATTMYRVRIPHLWPKQLPSPEPMGITANWNYAMARQFFKLAPAVVIIGYSFGRHFDSFDDMQSFNFMVDLIKTWPKPTFVVSPNPEELVEILRDGVSSYNVFGLPLRWELLSKIVIAKAHPIAGLQAKWCDQQLDEFIFDYECSIDTQ